MSNRIGQSLDKKVLSTIAFLAVIALFISSWAYLSLERQAILGGVLLTTAFTASLLPQYPKGRFGRVLLIMICFFLTARYWVFRTTITLTYTGFADTTFALLLYFAETYGILVYFLGMFVNIWPIERNPPPPPTEESQYPLVDVYIPTYNEPVEVVRITAIAASQLNYPKDKFNVYILDDGGTKQKLSDPDPILVKKTIQRTQALQEMAQELGATYLTRENNTSAKAGNINEALMSYQCVPDETALDGVSYFNPNTNKKGGDLILILDCDHAPSKDFLKKTIGFFIKDPKLFLVQTPHFFINPDPIEKNLGIFRKSPSENEMFYGAVQLGLDFWNASFFCGSAALLRRKYLMESGGISGQTITEDAETALQLHAQGYNSAYFNKPLIIGLTPETLEDFIVQRSRWAQGMVQIFILKNPLFQKGLSLAQKICYFNSSFFWFFGIARVTFFLAPLMLLFFGLKIYNASLAQVIAYAGPHLLAAFLLSNYLFGKFRHPFLSELYETIQSIYLLPAIISTILRPKAPVFKVTPKTVSLEKEFLSRLVFPFYILLALCIIGYIVGVYRLYITPQIAESITICLAWNTFNIAMLLCCLGVVWEKRQVRTMHRYATDEIRKLENEETGEELDITIIDISISGIGLATTEKNNSLHKGTKHILHVSDSYGSQYSLPLTIISQRQRQGKTILGCRFNTDKHQLLHQVVAFVYGDSSRWKFTGQLSGHGRISVLSGLFQVLKIGTIGFFAHTKGVLKLFFDKNKAFIKRRTKMEHLNKNF